MRRSRHASKQWARKKTKFRKRSRHKRHYDRSLHDLCHGEKQQKQKYQPVDKVARVVKQRTQKDQVFDNSLLMSKSRRHQTQSLISSVPFRNKQTGRDQSLNSPTPISNEKKRQSYGDPCGNRAPRRIDQSRTATPAARGLD